MPKKYIEVLCVDWLNESPRGMMPDGHSFHPISKSAAAIADSIETMKWGTPAYGHCPPETGAQTTEARLVRLPAQGLIARELGASSALRITEAQGNKPPMRQELMQLQFSSARIAICYKKPESPAAGAEREKIFAIQVTQARASLKKLAR